MSDRWRTTEDDVSRDLARLVKVLTRKKARSVREPATSGQAIVLATGLTVILDGGGSAITTSQPRPLVRVPFPCTVLAWYVNADQSGSIVVDVKRAVAATPTSFSSIAGTEKPTLSSQQHNSDTSLTTWTTSLNAGDWLRFDVESASAVQLVAIALHLTRTV